MSDVCEQPTYYRVTPKTAARMLREAIREHCRLNGGDYLDMEQQFQKVRAALTHLSAHESYQNPLHEQLQNLIGMVRNLIRRPDATAIYPVRQIAKIERIGDDLERLVLRTRGRMERVTLEEVEMFISVSDRLRESYHQAQYDPAESVGPVAYALAHLIAANFDVYDRTLNEK